MRERLRVLSRLTPMVPSASRAAAAVIALLFLAGCGNASTVLGADSAEGARTAADWRTLPEPPISPRTNTVAAWTGTEAVFLGGETGGICPPNAGCSGGPDLAKDGAAYNPATNQWRRVADAPVALAGSTPPAVLGDEVFVIAQGELLAYDAGSDRWNRHGRVAQAAREVVPIAIGDGRLVFAGGRADDDSPGRVYDPGTRTWSELPADPLRIASPWFTPTPAGLVITGTTTAGNGHTPDLVRAEVLDLAAGTWQTLPVSDQIGGYRWFWTGERMVAPIPGGCRRRRGEAMGTLPPGRRDARSRHGPMGTAA